MNGAISLVLSEPEGHGIAWKRHPSAAGGGHESRPQLEIAAMHGVFTGRATAVLAMAGGGRGGASEAAARPPSLNLVQAVAPLHTATALGLLRTRRDRPAPGRVGARCSLGGPRCKGPGGTVRWCWSRRPP